MHEAERIPEPWCAFLGVLDAFAAERVDLHCIGGFVVTRRYGFARETLDLDVLSIRPKAQSELLLQKAGKGSELHRRHRIYLDPVPVIDHPDDYETRLSEMYPGELKHLRLLAPEAHDLALMKLGRNIERDREDVKFLARQGFITAEGLEQRYREEMRSYIALAEKRTDPVIELWLEMIREEMGRGGL